MNSFAGNRSHPCASVFVLVARSVLYNSQAARLLFCLFISRNKTVRQRAVYVCGVPRQSFFALFVRNTAQCSAAQYIPYEKEQITKTKKESTVCISISLSRFVETRLTINKETAVTNIMIRKDAKPTGARASIGFPKKRYPPPLVVTVVSRASRPRCLTPTPLALMRLAAILRFSCRKMK